MFRRHGKACACRHHTKLNQPRNVDCGGGVVGASIAACHLQPLFSTTETVMGRLHPRLTDALIITAATGFAIGIVGPASAMGPETNPTLSQPSNASSQPAQSDTAKKKKTSHKTAPAVARRLRHHA